LRGAEGQERKQFFLKKRTKKLFSHCIDGAATRALMNKSFCFFFQKEGLSCFGRASLKAPGMPVIAFSG
jgi:hypothetical protein